MTKLKQIEIGQFSSNGNQTYVVIGLGEDGKVYRYERNRNGEGPGWVQLYDKVVDKEFVER